MLSNQDYLLVKLAEECTEVGQMVAKVLQFGLDEKQHEDGPSNRERLHAELNDLMAAIKMLNDEEGFGYHVDREAIDRKITKVSYYRGYSQSLGLVEEK
ncbi:hypothetical protein [Citrobacter phage Tr1]|nr:hypothetical protein [Citrobacter phage Tr1]